MKSLTAAYLLLISLLVAGGAWGWFASQNAPRPEAAAAAIAPPPPPPPPLSVAAAEPKTPAAEPAPEPAAPETPDEADSTAAKTPESPTSEDAGAKPEPPAPKKTTEPESAPAPEPPAAKKAAKAEPAPKPSKPSKPTSGDASPAAKPAAEKSGAGVRKSPPRVPLAPVQSALVEAGQDGPLPRIGTDGRVPWKIYGRPFSAPASRPRIALIVVGLGLNQRLTERAITELPPEVTLAFSPYGRNLGKLVEAARKAGHEVLVGAPMESDTEAMDPGPRALRTSLSEAANIVQLKWILSRFGGYVGVISEMGSRFTASAGALRPVVRETRDRGLVFVDSRTIKNSVGPTLARNMKAPFAYRDLYLDDEVSAASIDSHLREIEVIARLRGVGVAVGRAHPLTIGRIKAWSRRVARKGMVLAPITAIVGRQKVR